MNKKFLSVILFSALMVGTAGTFTSVSYTHLDVYKRQIRLFTLLQMTVEHRKTRMYIRVLLTVVR